MQLLKLQLIAYQMVERGNLREESHGVTLLYLDFGP